MKNRADPKEGVKALRVLMEGKRITWNRRSPTAVRDVTGPGIELLVGIEQFEEAAREAERERQ